MEAVLKAYRGGSYALPPLTEWEVTLTGSVPCDSFSVTCPYRPEMAAALEGAYRVRLTEADRFTLNAVVDEYEIVQNRQGRFVTVRGRGLAALLLDNESEAVEYLRPTLSEIAGRHAAPYGIAWAPFQEIRGEQGYGVESAWSQWKAISGFTRRFGGFAPRITPEGVLQLYPWRRPAAAWVIGPETPVAELCFKDRRYGVYSEVLVVDKVRRTGQAVYNESFLRRGGCCRRVLYTPGRSTAPAMGETGRAQLRQSERGARALTVALPFLPAVLPGGVVRMDRSGIGITGDFFVEEVRAARDSRGTRCSLTMGRLENGCGYPND